MTMTPEFSNRPGPGLFETAPYAAAISAPFPAEPAESAGDDSRSTSRELVLAPKESDSGASVTYTADGEPDPFRWTDSMSATFSKVAADEDFRL